MRACMCMQMCACMCMCACVCMMTLCVGGKSSRNVREIQCVLMVDQTCIHGHMCSIVSFSIFCLPFSRTFSHTTATLSSPPCPPPLAVRPSSSRPKLPPRRDSCSRSPRPRSRNPWTRPRRYGVCVCVYVSWQLSSLGKYCIRCDTVSSLFGGV